MTKSADLTEPLFDPETEDDDGLGLYRTNPGAKPAPIPTLKKDRGILGGLGEALLGASDDPLFDDEQEARAEAYLTSVVNELHERARDTTAKQAGNHFINSRKYLEECRGLDENLYAFVKSMVRRDLLEAKETREILLTELQQKLVEIQRRKRRR